MMSMTPNTSVRPVAIKAYREPVRMPSLAALMRAVVFKAYLPQAGFGNTIFTEFGSPTGFTCTNFVPEVPCHWKV